MLRDPKQPTHFHHFHQSVAALNDVGPPIVIASPWILFGGIFLVASIGGIAALMRGKQKITWRMFISASLNSGLASLGIALLVYDRLPVSLVLAISILSGIGGVSIADAALQAIRPKLGSIGVALLTAVMNAFIGSKDKEDK